MNVTDMQKAKALIEMLSIGSKDHHKTEQVLMGLLENRRWQYCLRSEATSYAYAALLIDFYSADEGELTLEEDQSRAVIKARMAEVSWLSKDELQAITAKEMAAALFGGVWCSLMLGSDVDDCDVADLILSYQPSFRPGLLPDSPGSLPLGTAGYRAIMTEHLDGWRKLKSARRVEELALWLGCAHMSFSRASYVASPDQPPKEYETVVVESLLTLLSEHDPRGDLSQEIEQVIIDGLLLNDRWQACMERTGFAYEFAALIARCCNHVNTMDLEPEVATRDKAMRCRVAQVLEQWTGLSDISSGISSTDLASVLFADFWCDIVLSGIDERGVADRILSGRPPFRVGPLAKAPAEQALPELD